MIRDFGSNSDAIVTAEDAASGSKEDVQINGANIGDSALLEDGELEEGEAEESEDPPMDRVFQDSSYEQASCQTTRDQHSSAPAVPAAMTNAVKDEALKNLMMSWYYAGYYTGLYEGQKSARQAPEKWKKGDISLTDANK